MRPYFRTPERIQKLQDEAARWQGTRFHARAELLGVGVDCIHLAAALYKATGALHSFEAPEYSLDEGAHADESKIISWLDRAPNFRPVTPPDVGSLLPGDLLCFKVSIRGVEHHVGVYLGGEMCLFVNSMIRYGVRLLSLKSPQWRGMLTIAFRPIETSTPP